MTQDKYFVVYIIIIVYTMSVTPVRSLNTPRLNLFNFAFNKLFQIKQHNITQFNHSIVMCVRRFVWIIVFGYTTIGQIKILHRYNNIPK